MTRGRWVLAVAALAVLIAAPWAASQPKRVRVEPKPEPVAETRLLMEALNESNFKALEKFLSAKAPAPDEAWVFARGQALLIAETGNLLLQRPPKRGGDETWKDLSAQLRERATKVARQMAARDRDNGRTALTELAQTCNQCHQTFRVPTRLTPFAAES